ncbi:MAG: trypsin-like peptidase domain-containing protein [Acidobacteria bacterium]|nr:trypsin-like peptidase domain-containing protein [Acidobacteriota bacterium]
MIVRRILTVVIAVLVATGSRLVVASGTTDELARCVALLRQDVPSDAKAGSGFLVTKNGDVFLVTAAHVARDIGANWLLIAQGADGRAATARMTESAWQFSAKHDVAVLKLDPRNEQRRFLLSRSLPARYLTGRPLPSSRDVTLTVMGYPLGIGVEGFMSPLSIETKAASGFLILPRFDTKDPATFILLQNPGVEVLSGGPVFDTGLSGFARGGQITRREGVSVVGLIHGELRDRGGGKMAYVVPASEIAAILGLPQVEGK